MSSHPYGNPHWTPSAHSPVPPFQGVPLQVALPQGVPLYQGAPVHPVGNAAPSGYGEELPRELLMLASAQNLGRLCVVCRPAKHIGYLVLFVVLGLLPLVFLFGPAWIGGIFLGGLLWPLAALGLMRNPVIVRSLDKKRIYFYDQGFVHSDGKGQLDVYRWDQIPAVFQRIVQTRYNGVPTGTQYLYTVTRFDGKTVKLTNFWEGVAELGREVNLRVSQVQLPAMQEALARGHNVQFGDIIVNAGGVSGKRGSAPWSEISRVAVRNGQVSLVRAGKFLPLSSTPASSIPNLPLFLHLATTYQQQGSRTR